MNRRRKKCIMRVKKAAFCHFSGVLIMIFVMVLEDGAGVLGGARPLGEGEAEAAHAAGARGRLPPLDKKERNVVF
jgi:hypothetical protein